MLREEFVHASCIREPTPAPGARYAGGPSPVAAGVMPGVGTALRVC